jgi:hypothetical protein
MPNCVTMARAISEIMNWPVGKGFHRLGKQEILGDKQKRECQDKVAGRKIFLFFIQGILAVITRGVE